MGSKQAGSVPKLAARDVYRRLGEALDNVMAASNELKKDKYRFTGRNGGS